MDIVDFSAWLQIFTGLNIAYAGFKDFRNYITKLKDKAKDLVELMSSSYESFYNYLTKKLQDTTSQISTSVDYSSTFKQYKEEFESDIPLIRYKSILEKDFTNKFKSVFFVSALVGFTLLFLCGYRNEIDEIIYHKLLFTLNFLTIGYGLIVFIISFFDNKIDKPINIFLNTGIFITVYLIVFFWRDQIDYSDSVRKYNIVIAMTSVMLPFFLFFLRNLLQLIFSVLFLLYVLLSGCIKLIYVNIIISVHRNSEKRLKDNNRNPEN